MTVPIIPPEAQKQRRSRLKKKIINSTALLTSAVTGKERHGNTELSLNAITQNHIMADGA